MKENSGKGEVLRNLVSLNIKRFRTNSGFSQEELAEKAGISVPYLGALERGEKWPSPDTFAGIAQGLGIAPFDLMRPEDASSQEVKKIITKLINDITTLVNSSLNKMNTVVRESSGPGK
jgi:transcriptional regulator with XRE-family HTH domain